MVIVVKIVVVVVETVVAIFEIVVVGEVGVIGGSDEVVGWSEEALALVGRRHELLARPRFHVFLKGVGRLDVGQDHDTTHGSVVLVSNVSADVAAEV